MSSAWWKKLLGLAILPALVQSYASTDSIQDADPPQSGYLPNHNMDPALVASSMAMSWKQSFNLNEMFYAKPLVYTPTGAANEYVITVSNQNIVRIHDGLTGLLLRNRTVGVPFASADLQCGDIPNTVGITGTPIIDPNTDIMYFFSKGYKNGQAGPQGPINGMYRVFAINLSDLSDAPGFPISLEGHNANNDRTRYFIGGTVLQRPGLAMLGNTIVAGFGGHCDNFNYTGMLIAVSKTPGVGVTNIQAMEASPGAPTPQELDITQQGGGKAGIWQGGMGLAADINRVFFITGNARGYGQNGGANGKAASGKTYLSTLEQAVVNMGVNPSTGNLTQQDYFETYAYDSHNGGDTDFGSGGLALLDGSVFNGANVNRIAVGAGKDQTMFIMNADDLGGFAGGSAGADRVLQSIPVADQVLGGIGSYPLEGGYIYVNPTGNPLYAYKFSRDASGKPVFTVAGQTARVFTSKSVPTITSNNGAPGSGIVWLADVNFGLQAYNAVPVNGVLTPINFPAGVTTGGISKFQRAVFGNGRVYTVKNSQLLSLTAGSAAAVPPPVTCAPTSLAFGSVMTDHTSTLSITCTANTAVTGVKCAITNSLYKCPTTPLPTTLAKGASTTFGVTFDLSSANIVAYQNANNAELKAGVQGATLNVYATATGYLPGALVPLTGTVVTSGGYLTVNMTTVNFGGVFIGGQQPSTASRAITLFNRGSTTLVFKGFAWQDYYADMSYHNVTSDVVGNGYTATNFPALGSSLTPGASIIIPMVFLPAKVGIAATYLTFWSDGGYTTTQMQGNAQQGVVVSSSSSSAAPTTSSSIVKPSSSTAVTSSSTPVTSTSTPVTSTSQPISSSTTVPSTTSSSAAPSSTGVRPQVGNYAFKGCWTESTTGRALSSKTYANDSMTLESCAAFCSASPAFSMFGVEYGRECYCGNTLGAGSVQADDPKTCSFLCPGDKTTYCGGSKRLQLYALGAAPTSSSSSSVAPTSSKPSSTSVGVSSSSSSSVVVTSSSAPTTLSTSTKSSAPSSTSTSALPYVTPPAPITRSLTWSVGWVNAAPDGFTRPFVGINGQWPCPAMTLNMGDTVKITVTNNLVNETTAIHFHGIFQTNTTYNDGPAMVTQCPIQPGGVFVYQFKISQPGTYWYHAHIGGQYIDGLRGPILVKDFNAPYRVDTEYALTLTDLYHSEAPPLINYYQSVDNANNNNGGEPVPNSGLINEAQEVKFAMVAGKKYLFRIINMGAFAPFWLQFDQHDMTIVEIDGVYTKPTTVSQLFITVAQRYSVIITAKSDASTNFAIKASMSQDMFNYGLIPTNYNGEVSAYLMYNAGGAVPAPLTITPAPFDDSVLTPYDQQATLGPVTVPIQLTVSFGSNANGQYRGFMNGVDYIPQKVPTLYTAMKAPAASLNNPAIYGANSNSFVVPYGAVVEILLQNHDDFAHPFHLHGHNFQVVGRTRGGPNFPINIPDGPPMRRDTVQVMASGSVTIRFTADNPGVALFHCHIEWHVEAGLTATIIEAPAELQAQKLYIPVSHRDVCDAQGIPREGNAAGNKKNYLDLTGANTVAAQQMWGAMVNPPSTPAGSYAP